MLLGMTTGGPADLASGAVGFDDARPHPTPLPRGEGKAVVRAPFFANLFHQSHRWFANETTSGSPSAGGEGWGEGERFRNLG